MTMDEYRSMTIRDRESLTAAANAYTNAQKRKRR